MNAVPEASKRILVFDSGLGGLSIVKELTLSSLDFELYYCADTAYFPYGEKSDQTLIERVPSVIAQAVCECSADIVIIACNTASTLALDHVRAVVNIPVVGVVPAIKPAAALTKSGVIGLLATPNTVGRPYTDRLILDFATGKKVLRHGAVGLASVAESKLSGNSVDMAIVQASIDGLFGQEGGDALDVVVLACTHYPHLKNELEALSPFPVTWMDSGAAIARRVQSLLDLESGKRSALKSACTTGGHDETTGHGLKLWGFQDIKALSPIASRR
jgi:glutamate racemase